MTSNTSKRKISDISIDIIEGDSIEEPQNKRQKLNPASAGDQFLQKNEKYTENDENHNETLSEQAYLPPEILMSIFLNLDQKSLLSAGCVCQHWWLISQDEELSWRAFNSYDLIEDDNCYTHYDSPFAKPRGRGESLSDMRKDRFGALRDPIGIKKYPHGLFYYYIAILDKDDQPIAITRDPTYFLSGEDPPEIPDLTPNLFRYSITGPRYEQEFFQWILRIEINIRRVEKILRAGGELCPNLKRTWMDMALKAQNKAFENESLFKVNEAYLPTVLPQITEQPQTLTCVKLHNYQINAINWMATVEKDSDKKCEMCPLIPIPGTNFLLNLTMDKQEIVLAENAKKYTFEFKAKGGVLADEMGLGKTLEMLGLIVSNPLKETPKNGSYFATKATLVLCPNHLVNQWKAEIEKHSEPKLVVVEITTVAQVKKLSYQQIIDADVVLVTYNLLKNKNYLAYPGHGTQIKVDKYYPAERIERVDKMLEDLKDKSPETIKGVILDHFHWHRVVMDEGHEVIDDGVLTDIICFLQRTFSWYMSGTPFPTLTAMYGVREFLDMFVRRAIWCFPKGFDEDYFFEEEEEQGKNTPELLEKRTLRKYLRNGQNWSETLCRPVTEVFIGSLLNDFMLNNLVWRNTKESIKNEYAMVDIKQQVILLDFTPIEAAIYEELVLTKSRQLNTMALNSNKDPVSELCCKLNYAWGKTQEEMREFMIKKINQDIDLKNRQIDLLSKKKEDYERRLQTNEATDIWFTRKASEFIARYPKALADYEDVLKNVRRVLQIFENLPPRDTKNIEYNTKEFWVENYGTKLANLVIYLKKLFSAEPTTRVIIFSQFSDYLEMIGALLDENEISSCFVEGNIFKKNKALHKFKDGDSEVKVILLSLSKAASGTNLIEASHVLLMDPMTGTKEEAQAYENQAIGRAQRQGQTKPVTVVRFIIHNTVEEEFYVRNTGSNHQHGQVVTLNRSNSRLIRSSSTIGNNNSL